jgi:hypothetical protein
MMNSQEFADRQLELTAEFGKYVFAHPEVDDQIPNGAYVYFEVEGDSAFNAYTRTLADRKRKEGVPVVLVRSKGLAPPQDSRLIDPVIEAVSAVA